MQIERAYEKEREEVEDSDGGGDDSDEEEEIKTKKGGKSKSSSRKRSKPPTSPNGAQPRIRSDKKKSIDNNKPNVSTRAIIEEELSKNKRKREDKIPPIEINDDDEDDDDSQPKKRTKSEKKTPVIDNTMNDECYFSKSPFYSRSTGEIVKTIFHSLSDILHQDSAKESLIHRAYARIATPVRDKNPSQRILSLHLTGGSGVGKTVSAEKFAYGLGVGPGTPYPNNYYHMNLGKYSDQSHAVAITGAAAGLVGYNDGNMVTKLKEIAKVDCPFIVLHMDEACKAHPAFMNGLNPLLSEGKIADVREAAPPFVIPNETLLIIIWTSNFGEDIADPTGDPESATRHVHALMRAKGYDHCDIGRMGGDPIFYKPLTADNMYSIIEKKGYSRLCHHPFSREFDVPVYKQRTSASLSLIDSVDSLDVRQPNLLIRNIMKTYKPELGVRHPLEKYKGELDELLTVAHLMVTLDSTVDDKKKKKKKKKRSTYWCRQIKITVEDRTNRDSFLMTNPWIAIAISLTQKNRDHLKRILDDPQQTILEYAVLKFYDKEHNKRLAYSILQPVSDSLLRTNSSPNVIPMVDDNDDDDMMSSSSSSSSSSLDTETVSLIKSQNEVLRGQYDSLTKDFKLMKRQLDVLLINQKTGNNAPVYQTITTTTSLQAI